MILTACQTNIQDLFDEVLLIQGSAEEFTLSGGLGYTMDSAVLIGFVQMGVREDMDHHERFIALEYTFIEERINCEVSTVDQAESFSYRTLQQQTETINQRKMEKIIIEVIVNFDQGIMEKSIYSSVFWFDIHDAFGVAIDEVLMP